MMCHKVSGQHDHSNPKKVSLGSRRGALQIHGGQFTALVRWEVVQLHKSMGALGIGSLWRMRVFYSNGGGGFLLKTGPAAESG